MDQWLELRGFSVDRNRFLLAADVPQVGDREASKQPHILERALVDFQCWDRLLHRTEPANYRQRIPTRRLRRLTAANWVRGDTAKGWRLEFVKTVRECEKWLNDAFARLPKQHQSEFLDDGLYAAAKHKQAAARAERKRARDLQQYFTTSPLVDDVLKRVMEFLQQTNQQEVVWLEPSCGDGRFLTALLRAGARRVVGYEIDERVQRVATEKVREEGARSSADGQVCLGDFLQSKRSVSADQIVVAIGNPPFGARGDDGGDLVHDFFRHAAYEWQASVIAFIVPERCSRPSFVETTLQQLNSDCSDKWQLARELPLTDSQFEFGVGENLKRVRQPSVLQVLSRVR